ncbi:pilus assembly protein [Mariniblastus sp.]|nr:pilus assembly protein [Mariniblastus sp.]
MRQSKLKRNRVGTRTRDGLAPVEMALTLPLLMGFVAALVAFGYAASWKIRSEVVARNVGWRNRHPRWAHWQAYPAEWPTTGTFDRHGAASLNDLAQFSVTEAPIIRGPISQVNVNSNILNLSRDVTQSGAQIRRTPPLLPRLGEISYDTSHQYLDDFFTHSEMGISNSSRRIPRIYGLDLDFVRDSAPVLSAVSAIENNPRRQMLIALDQDPEFIAWDGSADDWHLNDPIKTHNYELDVDWVREQRVEVYLNDIERLPERMVKSTIGLYEKQIKESEPPLSDAAIAQLERKIQELEDYLDRLADRAGGQ